MLTVARKERLLQAFREAGLRGLTADEMRSSTGEFWRLRLSELRADGYQFCEHPSRVRPGTTFRWVLVSEPPTGGGDSATQEPLFSPTPDSAIGGE